MQPNHHCEKIYQPKWSLGPPRSEIYSHCLAALDMFLLDPIQSPPPSFPGSGATAQPRSRRERSPTPRAARPVRAPLRAPLELGQTACTTRPERTVDPRATAAVRCQKRFACPWDHRPGGRTGGGGQAEKSPWWPLIPPAPHQVHILSR